jgi:S-adenosylmethionine hydrolase
VDRGALHSHILYVDTFGNVKLTALAPQLTESLGRMQPGDALDLELGGTRHERITWQATFGGAALGRPLLYEDSYGRLCIAVNQGNAADQLALREDLPVVIRRAG